MAIIVSIIWSAVILTTLSYNLAKSQKVKPFKVIREHLTIATLVMIPTFYVGKFIAIYFR